MKRVTTCVLVSLLLLIIVPAFAKNYYVDPSSAGSNEGTLANPWKSMDAIPSDINYFLPGDTVFFRRGQHFVGTLSINSTGAPGAPIVFMPYGNGNAPIFHYNLSNPNEPVSYNRMIIRLNQVNHIVIDGFELIDTSIPEYDRTVTANVGHGVFIYKGPNDNGSYNVIKNLTISRLAAGVNIDGGHHNTITNCTIRNMRMAINTPNSPWDDHGAVGIVLGGSDNSITYNKFEGCWANSYDYQYDGGAIEMYGSVNNNRILYNTATDNLGFMEFGSNNGAPAINNLVGYNLLVNNGHILWINNNGGFGVDVRNLQIFNNNIIETKPPLIADVTSLIGILSHPAFSNIITLKNNIFWLTRYVNITDPNHQPFNGPQLVHQNNVYRMAGGALGFGLDATELNLPANDQLFMDNSAGNPLTWDFNLKPASAAVNFGQVTGIDKDFYGRGVPFGNAPDAGIAENIATVLPVQILSTRGWNSTEGNTIEWVTNTDTADHFEVERSSSGTNFTSIAKVPYKATTNTTITYQFVDNNVTGDVQYYRVKVIERDRTTFYSPVVTIKKGQPATALMVSPNPVKDELTITIPAANNSNKELVLFNTAGMAIKKMKVNANGNQIKLNVSTLPRGIYVVHLTDTHTGQRDKTIFTK